MVNSRFKIAYTLGDLFVVVALAGLMIALVNAVQRNDVSKRRLIQSIWLPGDGSRLFAAFQDGEISSWDLTTGSAATHVEPTDGYYSYAPVVISPDGRLAARILRSKTPPPERIVFTLQVCDLQTGQERFRRTVNILGSVAFSPDGTRMAIDNPRDNVLNIVEVAHPEHELQMGPLDTTGPKADASAWDCPMLFSDDGEELYRFNTEGELTKWNLATGRPLRRQLEPGRHHLLPLRLQEHQLVVATAPAHGDPGLMIGEKRGSDGLDRMGEPVSLPDTPAIAAIHHGKWVALLSRSAGLQVIDLETSELQKSIEVDWLVWLLAARDTTHGQVIAIANDQAVWLLDGDRWRKIVNLESSHWRAIVLALAIPLVCGMWLWLRIRRQRLSASREGV